MITIEHLTKRFFHGPHATPMDVFQDFSCRFQEGTTTAILGPSGGGKTTLGRILCGLASV